MKVAIIIPTMNRPDFIERTIAYYEYLKCPHPIYIGDASDSVTAARINATIERCSNVDVKYFNWEHLGANQTIVKLAEIAQAECHFCAFHGDDDYLVPASLSRCAEFLSNNPGYRTAQGRAALFTLDRAGPYGEIRSLQDYWGVNALEQDAAVDRFVSFDKNYFVLQFSTHRTEEFVQDSRLYLGIKDDLVGELLHCFTFAIKGKSKFLDCLYLIRNSHEGVFHPEFADWVTKEHWATDYHKTLVGLSFAIHETSDLPLNEAEKIVSDTFKLRTERHIERRAQFKLSKNKLNILSKLKGFLPVSLKNNIKQVTSDVRDMRILSSKKSYYYNDFFPVLLSLTNELPVKKRG